MTYAHLDQRQTAKRSKNEEVGRATNSVIESTMTSHICRKKEGANGIEGEKGRAQLYMCNEQTAMSTSHEEGGDTEQRRTESEI